MTVIYLIKYLEDHGIDNIPLDYEDIISLTRNLNPNGSVGISLRMLLLWDESIVLS